MAALINTNKKSQHNNEELLYRPRTTMKRNDFLDLNLFVEQLIKYH